MLNNITIMGRLTKQPELRHTQDNNAVCAFCIACDRYAKRGEDKKTDFIDIVAWNKTAEFVSRFFNKGDAIIITGRLQTRQYTDRDGNSRKAVEIAASEINFAANKGERSAAPADDYDDDEEVPF